MLGFYIVVSCLQQKKACKNLASQQTFGTSYCVTALVSIVLFEPRPSSNAGAPVTIGDIGTGFGRYVHPIPSRLFLPHRLVPTKF